MDYGNLIRRAWNLTWRHRFLWVLGLFATSMGGSCSAAPGGNNFQWQLSSDDVGRLYSSDLARALQDADPWLIRNIGFVILGILVVVAVVALLAFVVSMIAQGAMARATSDLALGRAASAGEAWRTGLQVVWRYVAMWLIVIGLGIVIAAAVAILIAIAILIVRLMDGAPRTAVLMVGGLAAALLALIALPVLAAATVVLTYAQRAIWVEGTGAWSALRTGYGLLRRNFGTSAIAWLISIGLTIGVGIGILVGVVIMAIPLGIVAFVLYSAGGISTALGLYGLAAIVAVILGAWALAGVANAFFWNYWTLTYLYVTNRLTAQLEPPGAEGPGAG